MKPVLSQSEQERLQTAMLGVYTELKKAVDVAMPIVAKICNAAYETYIEAGAIYGESYEGFSRWFFEINEIDRLKRQIEEIETRHWVIADTKRMMAKKRGG